MIPCQKTCADYCEGCHKNCARWKAFLEQSSQQRREKKRYLDYYNDLCSTIIRQCRSNNPYLSHRASEKGAVQTASRAIGIKKQKTDG